jgi:hypothetical protein
VGQIEIPVRTQSLERRKLFRRKSCAFHIEADGLRCQPLSRPP